MRDAVDAADRVATLDTPDMATRDTNMRRGRLRRNRKDLGLSCRAKTYKDTLKINQNQQQGMNRMPPDVQGGIRISGYLNLHCVTVQRKYR